MYDKIINVEPQYGLASPIQKVLQNQNQEANTCINWNPICGVIAALFILVEKILILGSSFTTFKISKGEFDFVSFFLIHVHLSKPLKFFTRHIYMVTFLLFISLWLRIHEFLINFYSSLIFHTCKLHLCYIMVPWNGFGGKGKIKISSIVLKICTISFD